MQADGQILDTCTGIQHIGIPTEDMEKTCAFYTELGFQKASEAVINQGQRVVFLQFQNVTLECYEGEASGKPGAIEHIALNCKDVETACRMAEEKGYTIVSNGIEELPFWENGVRFFIIQGPNGEKIELNQYL